MRSRADVPPITLLAPFQRFIPIQIAGPRGSIAARIGADVVADDGVVIRLDFNTGAVKSRILNPRMVLPELPDANENPLVTASTPLTTIRGVPAKSDSVVALIVTASVIDNVLDRSME